MCLSPRKFFSCPLVIFTDQVTTNVLSDTIDEFALSSFPQMGNTACVLFCLTPTQYCDLGVVHDLAYASGFLLLASCHHVDSTSLFISPSVENTWVVHSVGCFHRVVVSLMYIWAPEFACMCRYLVFSWVPAPTCSMAEFYSIAIPK